MSETGRVLAVQEDIAGTVLAADASGVATTLTVLDTDVFDEDGGTLRVIGDAGNATATYSNVNDTALTVDIDPALGFAAATGEEVRLEPLSVERYAMVALEDAPDVPIAARVPHALVTRLGAGIRDEDDREAVSVVEDSPGDWHVSDVLARGFARIGYAETDWANEYGVPLVAGDPSTNVPFAVLGTGVILPIFYAGGGSPVTNADINAADYSKYGASGVNTAAMTILIDQPSIIYADANAWVENENASTGYNTAFTIIIRISGVDSNGTPYRQFCQADDNAQNRGRGLSTMRRYYLDPAGTPTSVTFYWGYKNDSGGNKKATIGGQKMRVIVSYAPDAAPDGSTYPVWTNDQDTIDQYVVAEVDE